MSKEGDKQYGSDHPEYIGVTCECKVDEGSDAIFDRFRRSQVLSMNRDEDGDEDEDGDMMPRIAYPSSADARRKRRESQTTTSDHIVDTPLGLGLPR